MFCRYCGLQIPDDSIFCRRCGKDLTKTASVAQPYIKQPQQNSNQPYIKQPSQPAFKPAPQPSLDPEPQPAAPANNPSSNPADLNNILCSYRIEKKNALKKLNLLGTEKGYFSVYNGVIYFTKIQDVGSVLLGSIGGAAFGVAGAIAGNAIGNHAASGKYVLSIPKFQMKEVTMETLFKTKYLVIKIEGKEIAFTCNAATLDSLYNWLKS